MVKEIVTATNGINYMVELLEFNQKEIFDMDGNSLGVLYPDGSDMELAEIISIFVSFLGYTREQIIAYNMKLNIQIEEAEKLIDDIQAKQFIASMAINSLKE